MCFPTSPQRSLRERQGEHFGLLIRVETNPMIYHVRRENILLRKSGCGDNFGYMLNNVPN